MDGKFFDKRLFLDSIEVKICVDANGLATKSILTINNDNNNLMTTTDWWRQ